LKTNYGFSSDPRVKGPCGLVRCS